MVYLCSKCSVCAPCACVLMIEIKILKICCARAWKSELVWVKMFKNCCLISAQNGRLPCSFSKFFVRARNGFLVLEMVSSCSKWSVSAWNGSFVLKISCLKWFPCSRNGPFVLEMVCLCSKLCYRNGSLVLKMVLLCSKWFVCHPDWWRVFEMICSCSKWFPSDLNGLFVLKILFSTWFTCAQNGLFLLLVLVCLWLKSKFSKSAVIVLEKVS